MNLGRWCVPIGVATALLMSMSARAGEPPAKMSLSDAPKLREIVISVFDLERTLAAFTGPLGWTVVERGTADTTVARVLGLPVDTQIDQALLSGRTRDGVEIRLLAIRSDDKARTPIRPGGRWWDVGGFGPLQIAVADVDTAAGGLARLGWTGNGVPQLSSEHRMIEMRGPDDLTISLTAGDRGSRDQASGTAIVRDISAWRRFMTEIVGLSNVVQGERHNVDPDLFGLPGSARGMADHRLASIELSPTSHIDALQFSRAIGHDFSDGVRAPRLGVLALRLQVSDEAMTAARTKSQKADVAADLQIERLSPYGTVRTMALRAPGGLVIEMFTPEAKPMTEAELKSRFARGGYATWVRFNNLLTGNVRWNADGTAHVVWDTGNLDELGTWTIKGDAVCTAWTRLRSNRELCVHHYRLDANTTQSFRSETSQPDGIYTWH